MSRETGLNTARKDMTFPCKDCKLRKPACSDHCPDPKYWEAKRLREELRKQREKEWNDRNYDFVQMSRRNRTK